MNENEEFVCTDGTRLPVSVRVSSRAKRRKLSLNFQGELEVVVPAYQLSSKRTQARRRAQGFGRIPLSGRSEPPRFMVTTTSLPEHDEIVAFLEQNRKWIESATKRTSPQREAYEQSKSTGLPARLDFPLAQEVWLVEYQQTQAKSITAKSAGLRRIEGSKQIYSLRLTGAISDEALCRKALIRFVAFRAKQVIPPFAREVCHAIGASPNSITVNNRKSAWGLCTRAGDIRIDRRVLFLPTALARQIVLHEAAHLTHLNHSARFYETLYSYPDSTLAAEKAVKKALTHIPAWFIDGAQR